MQIEFLRDRARAQVGQKADSMPAAVVSATSNTQVSFGDLLVFDDSDAFMAKLPSTPAHLKKPLGVALRQLHCEDYQPKSSIAAMRKGRVWVQAEQVAAPGDAVFIKFRPDGSHGFSGVAADNTVLAGAVFLESCEQGLVPIEVDFFGGVA